MRLRLCPIVLLCALPLLLAACGLGARPLSDAQLQQLLRERNIQPLDVREIDGTATAILYTTPSEIGCIVAWSRAGVSIVARTAPLNAVPRRDGAQPLAAIGMRVFDYDLLCLTTNDPIARRRASSIELGFSSTIGATVPAYNQGNLVIWRYDRQSHPVSIVVLYDQDGFIVGQLDRTPAGFVPFYR